MSSDSCLDTFVRDLNDALPITNDEKTIVIDGASDPDYDIMVANMRSRGKYKTDMCKREQDPLKKCILCKYLLTPTQWALVMEDYIKKRFHIGPCKNNTSGDGCSINNHKNVEIKVSLGGKDGQASFVQLRPHHTIDYYVLMSFDVSSGNRGVVTWFLCDAKELYSLLPKYGGYAHGTIEVNGKITEESIQNHKYEYALRPNPLKKNHTLSKQLWNIMVEKFGVSEETILSIL